MEYYSAIKKNEIGSFVEMWMNLETVIHSKVSEKEKNKYRVLTHINGNMKKEKKNILKTKKKKKVKEHKTTENQSKNRNV